MARYSIIIPVYNKELYVARTIESVLKQSVRDWEIIAVDDESGDSSLQILQELSKKDERIKVYSIENKGVSNARNFAMKQACGEYIMFLDADDEMQPDILSEYELILEKNNNDNK